MMMPNTQADSLGEGHAAIEAPIAPAADEPGQAKEAAAADIKRGPLLKDYHPLQMGLPGRYA